MKRSPKTMNPLLSDVPVEKPDDDQLGRAHFAATLAKTIRSMKGTESFAFAICGPWGCGKSSVLRMIARELRTGRSKKKPIVVNFNPWWFSGQDQLLGSFLGQLSAVLGVSDAGASISKLGKRLGTFAKVLRPFGLIPGAEILKEAAEIFGDGGEAAENLGEQLSTDVHRLRADIDKELRKCKRRIVIVMDDIDRLTAVEIAQLFVIVKAVADFPNTVYLLSFDHAVVCKAIQDKLGLDGASYLEKIVQIHVDVPPASPVMLQQMFLGQLNKLIDSGSVNGKTHRDFGNCFHDGLTTFLETPRSVKRLTNVLRVLYPAVEGEVYWPDFVTMTALQVFVPNAYRSIRDNQGRFVGQFRAHLGYGNRDEEKRFHEGWIENVPLIHRPAVTELARRLFPRVQSALGGSSFGSEWESRWKADLRICASDCIARYFQFHVPQGELSESEWKEFLDGLSDPEIVDDNIKRWCNEPGPNRFASRAKEFLEKVSIFAQQSESVEQAKQLLAALLRNGDLMISIEDEDRSPGISIDNEMRVSWAAQSLLERLPEGSEREQTLEHLLPSAGLATMSQLVWLFGAEHGRFGSEPYEPHRVSAECVDRLQSIAVSRLKQAADDGTLSTQRQPLSLARDWRKFDDDGAAEAWVTKACQDDETLARFLICAQTSTSTHAFSDRVATIGKSASADFLVMWFNGKALRERCEQILESAPSWLTSGFRSGLQLVIDSLDQEGNPLDPFHRRVPGADQREGPVIATEG